MGYAAPSGKRGDEGFRSQLSDPESLPLVPKGGAQPVFSSPFGKQENKGTEGLIKSFQGPPRPRLCRMAPWTGSARRSARAGAGAGAEEVKGRKGEVFPVSAQLRPEDTVQTVGNSGSVPLSSAGGPSKKQQAWEFPPQ